MIRDKNLCMTISVKTNLPEPPPPTVESFDLLGVPPDIFMALRDLVGHTNASRLGIPNLDNQWVAMYETLNGACTRAGLARYRTFSRDGFRQPSSGL